MLLTITTTHRPATDLGFLLVKHPDKCQSFSLAYGTAHVFYPEATDEICTAALLLDFDPVGLVRGRRRQKESQGTLAQYVNDRPYVASSFLSVAIAQVFSSALHGQSKHRPDLTYTAIPLEANLAVLPCRGGEGFLRSLFEPLGYDVEARRHPLDPEFPHWGEGPYHDVTLRGELPLKDLLSHLYVLLPVLDNDKHYWVGDDELEKLLEKGGGWLASHPEREQIARRYLKHQRSLTREALERLVAEDDPQPDETEEKQAREEENLERGLSLNEQRIGTILAVLKETGATSVVDVGCGEGRLIAHLLKDKTFTRIAGMDVSMRCLEIASERLKLERMSERQRKRIELFHGSLTYRDERLAGFDAICAIEVIEHVDESRLKAFERTVFEFPGARFVIVTTPNKEYNQRFENLPAGKLRHKDHRFEWTRAEFEAWGHAVAEQHGCAVKFRPVGDIDPEVGAATQMGVFSR